jgi:tetratricopeptide (TPR) repeat protein
VPPLDTRRGRKLLFAILGAAGIILLLWVAVPAWLRPKSQATAPTELDRKNQELLAETEQIYAAGNSAFQKEDFEEAVARYSSALKIMPDNKAVYLKRGMANLALLNYAESLSDYNNAIRLDPSFVDAYFARGTLHWLLGEVDEAETDYSKTVQMQPDDKAYYDRLATVLYELEKGTAVVDLYKNAYMANKMRDWALWGWLSAVYTIGEADTSALAQACRDLENQGVRSAAVSYHAGIVSFLSADYQASIDKLEEAKRMDPQNTPTYASTLLYQANRKLGNSSRAEEYRQEVINKSGQDPQPPS